MRRIRPRRTSHAARPPRRVGTVLKRFAFATDRHARQAVGYLLSRRDLFRRAAPIPARTPADFAYVEFEVDAARVDRAMALANGMHALPVEPAEHTNEPTTRAY